MTELRLFTAISLPTWMAETIVTYQRSQDRLRSGLRWVNQENLHITAAFYGSVPEGALTGLRAAIAQAVAERTPFEIQYAQVTWAPSPQQATMVWAELVGTAEFADLAERAHRAALGLAKALPPAKPARPHITLARLEQPLALPSNSLPPLAITPDRFTVMELGLYQLVRGPEGPDYHLIDNFPLLG